LTLDLCAELARLAPFGLGNPGVTLLVAGCELSDVATVGDGKHLRFRVKDGARDAGSAIAFGFGRQIDRFRQEVRFDVAFRLEENHWNGTVAPQLVVKRVFDGEPRYRELREWLAGLWREGVEAWPPEAAAIFAELELGDDESGRRHLLESPAFRRLLDELPSDIEAYNPEVDRELLARAFRFAADAHEGQQRRSGEAFIRHPWGAAKILAELRQDEQTIAAALLHDVVEDTETEIEEVRTEFGDEIAQLVEGVTKLTRIHFQSREQAEAENYRKMIAAMVGDERVILIKLADRLHNMRTIEYLGKQKQLQKARETLEVYAPLAHRLGIHKLKWELEDLSFQTLHPRRYAEIKQMVNERRADREEHVNEARLVLQQELDKVDIPADISGRAKHFYSIYDKMARKGREFNEIYDLTAMRVIVQRDGEEGTRDCYGALGLIHS